MAMVTRAHLAQAVREQVGPTLGAVPFGSLFEKMAERLVAGDALRVGARPVAEPQNMKVRVVSGACTSAVDGCQRLGRSRMEGAILSMPLTCSPPARSWTARTA